MADILDFENLYNETEDTIRARIEADADTDIDKRPGEIFYDITTPIILELQRLWDSVNYYASVSFLPWSFGTYLDYKGNYEIGLTRVAATTSSGYVTFIGDRDTVVPTGTIASTSARVIGDTVYQFQTTMDDQVGMLAPLSAITAAAGVSGTITKTNLSYKVTFVGRGGETDPSPATSVLSVTSKKVNLSNIPVGPYGTTARNIYRQEASGGNYLFLATIANNTTTVYLDNTNTNASVIVAPTTNSTDRVAIPATSIATGINNNVSAYAIDQLVDAVSGIASVTNESYFVGGVDLESDDDYRTRLVQAIASPAGQGNKADYVAWAKTIDGVDNAIVLPLWNGANTVKVVLIGPDNTTVSATVVSNVQAAIDPNIDGAGGALAPIGAVVTVVAASQVAVALSATIVHESDYSLDGTSGTSATRTAINTAVATYIKSLPIGGDVIWAEVLSAIVTVLGVADVTGLTLNGSAANVAISSTQVPSVTLTLS